MSTQQASARILFVSFVLVWLALFVIAFWGPIMAFVVYLMSVFSIVLGSIYLGFWLFKKGWIDE